MNLTHLSPWGGSILYRMDKIVEALVAQKFRVRPAAQSGEEWETLRGLVRRVYVEERGYWKEMVDDPWDTISQYYLVTVDGAPAGSARMVDPLCFPEAARRLPQVGARCRLPMEEDFPLAAHLPDEDGFFEAGRFTLLPSIRGAGGLAALMGCAYLHALRCGRPGAVCLNVSVLTKTYLKTGWHPLGASFRPKTYDTEAQAMLIHTKNVAPAWAKRFLEMEARGVIAI